MKPTFVCVMVTLVYLSVDASQNPSKPDFTLDVASRGRPIAVEPEDGVVSVSVPSRITHEPGSGKRISVTLRRLDQPSFTWDDEYVYEIEIMNVGNSAVMLPWSSDVDLWRAARRGGRPELRHGGVSIEIRSLDDQQVLATLEWQLLAGSDLQPSTLQRLGPNQRAVMRLLGRWHSFEANATEKVFAQNGDIRVAAIVTLLDDGLVQRSANSIVTTVLPRRR